MVRGYNRKTNRANYNAKIVNAAVKFLQDEGHSLREAQEELVITVEHFVAIPKQDKPIHLDMQCQEKYFPIILKKIYQNMV